MKNFVIFIDSNCDISQDVIKDADLKYVCLTCKIDNNEYIDNFGVSLSYEEFYNKIRNGAMPKTSQVNSYTFYEAFEPYVKEGIPILYVGFSAPLSGTFNSSTLAREELLEKYPDAKINLVNSLCASGGCGLLAYYASKLRAEGKTFQEVTEWVEQNKLHMIHYFTVDDLGHLKRGGRISATTAVVGGMLNIKPILTLNNEGKLEALGKVKGRKKSIKTLFEKVAPQIECPEEQIVVITHGDALEEAQNLANMLKERLNVKEVLINHAGLTIGTHVGPGMLAIFAMGREREK